MADYAIHDTTLEDIANTIRKKDGTFALIDPADYPKRINLMGMLEEKTQASASICAFDDGADDVPSSSVKVAIPANLDGVSSVNVVNSGKNILDKSILENGNFQTISPQLTHNVVTDGFIPIKGGADYVYSCLTATSGVYFRFFDSTQTELADTGVNAYNTTSKAFTTPIESYYMRVMWYHSSSEISVQDIIDRNVMVEVGSTPSTYAPYTTLTTYTASLGLTIYGGEVDIVNGTGTDENGNDFTFAGQEVPTRLGYNAFWSDSGDTEVVYRSSGTVTPIVPTLITKTITANGTYTAEDDDADGYDEVVVNVASQEPIVTPLNSPNPFVTISGISGTDIERTARTITAPSNGKYIFADDSTCRTNTGSGDGFFDIRKNDVSIVKQYMAANTTTSISIPEIEVETGDEIDIIVGFDNAHSSCNFQLYTGIAFSSVASSASLLSMGGGYSGSAEEQNETEETDEVSEYSDNEEQGEEI